MPLVLAAKLVAMARSSDKKMPPKQAERKGKTTTIPKYALFAKASLAPYPSEDGAPLWLGHHENLQELLDLGNVFTSRTAKNSEMLSRPEMAMNLAAAAIHHGGNDVVKNDIKEALAKVTELLKEDSGKALLEACSVLNVGKDGTASREKVERAVHKYVKFFTNEKSKRMRGALVDLVGHSARIYLLCMHLLEQLAFFAKLGGWAKKWSRTDKQPSAMKPWLKEPAKVAHLEDALVSLMMEKIRKAQAKKEAQDETSNSSASPDTAASRHSSVSKKSRDKERKRKQERKKDAKDKKSRKHSKSPKNKKKKARSRSCSSVPKSKRRRSSYASRSDSEKKQSPGAHPAASALRFGDSDQETTPADEAVPEALVNWALAEAKELSKEVVAGLENIDDKSKRLSLQAVVALLDNLPDNVLEFAGLVEARSSLKEMKRLPRKEKVEPLLVKLQELASGRIAAEPAVAADATNFPKTVKIHRIGAVSATGQAVVKEGDPVDEVDIAEGDTVEDIVLKLFKAQGSTEDRGNWKVKELSKDNTLTDISSDTTPASVCPNIALLRKGG